MKQKLIIDPLKLQECIDQLESAQQFTTRGALFNAVEGTEWAKSLQPRPLTAQVAYIRAKELGLTFKTKAGIKGFKQRPLVEVQEAELATCARLSIPVVLENTEELVSLPVPNVPRKRGSLKAAIREKCIDCSGGSKVEVRKCPIVSCSLHQFRPFQIKK